MRISRSKYFGLITRLEKLEKEVYFVELFKSCGHSEKIGPFFGAPPPLLYEHNGVKYKWQDFHRYHDGRQHTYTEVPQSGAPTEETA